MSKIKSDTINFTDEDVIIECPSSKKNEPETELQGQILQKELEEEYNAKLEKLEQKMMDIEVEANKRAEKILADAELKAEEILENAKIQAQQESDSLIENTKTEIEKEKQEILENAKTQAQQESDSLIENTKTEIEKERIEETKKGYEDGYQDGLKHIQEEQEEKIKKLDEFCLCEKQIRDKILKSATKDIVSIISTISKKILLKELDGKTLDKIIKNTISLLKDKSDITIVVSEDYAKILYDFQTKNNDDESELKFENFKQYDNYKIVFNPKFTQDTIIVENLEERLDASISSQLNVILQEIYEKTENNFELEEDINNET